MLSSVPPEDRLASVHHGSSQGAVTPITISTRKASRPISVGLGAIALTITSATSQVYVLNAYGDGTVNSDGTATPIRISSDTAAASVKVGRYRTLWSRRQTGGPST